MISKHLKKADIAERAGVSRAAVTKWFQSEGGMVNVESQTLLQLARGLNVTPEIFLKPTPDLSSLQTRFLWDHLYPDMESFIQALLQNRMEAIARCVQVLEFREAVALLGKKTIRCFDQYKKFIKPARRKELEILCPLYTSQT